MWKFVVAIYWVLTGISFGWGGGMLNPENVSLAYTLILVGVVLSIIGAGNWLRGKKLESLEDSITNSRVVWGLWHTGTSTSGELLINKEQIKRVLLPQIKETNPALKFQTNLSGSNNIQCEMNNISNIKERILPDRLRGYTEPFTYAFTIFDRNPVGNDYKPTSDKAWVIVQVLEPNVSPKLRSKYIIKNKGKDSIRFKEFYNLFERLWNENISIDG